MGVSTDGILAYGWDLGSDGEEDHWAYELVQELCEPPYDSDVEEFILAKLGYEPIDAPFVDQMKARREALGACPFDIIMHCSLDDTKYILTLKEANWSASRGYPVDLKHRIAYLAASIKEYDITLWDAAAKLGAHPTEPPGLLLASIWI